GAHSVHELGEDVLALRGGAEPVFGRGRQHGHRHVLVGRVHVQEDRPEQADHREHEHDGEADHQFGVPHGEVQGFAADHAFLGGQCRRCGGGHACAPAIPVRVRGSMSTYTMSMMKLATSTPTTMNMNEPWSRKKSWFWMAFRMRLPIPG